MYYLLSQAKTGWYFSAMGLNFKELEFPGSDTPWIHGFPHLWWSQGSTTQVQQQAWQVTTFKSIKKMFSILYIHYTIFHQESVTLPLLFKLSPYMLIAHKYQCQTGFNLLLILFDLLWTSVSPQPLLTCTFLLSVWMSACSLGSTVSHWSP